MDGRIKDAELPLVTIVGRPNVGKSTLFNRLVGRRMAVVERTPGVTRDVVTAVVDWEGRAVELADTGGLLDGVPADALLRRSVEMVHLAMEEADVVLFVVDAVEGLHPLDETLCAKLRASKTPVVLVANKADNPALEREVGEFHRLGLGEPLPVSAVHGAGCGELREKVAEMLPEGGGFEEPPLRIAMVGKRNAGKSTLLNALAGAERVLVDERPGTTRDAVEVVVGRGRRRLVLVDTAGVRRKGRMEDSVELFSAMRTESAIGRAGVVLLLVDAALPVSRVDKRLARLVVASVKPVVLVVNKWDLAEGRASVRDYGRYLRAMLPGLSFAPLVFVSALRRWNLDGMMKVADDLWRQSHYRCGTGRLNRLISEAVRRRQPPRVSVRKQPKIYYATQPGVAPPTILLFVNEPSWFDKLYLRYIENFLRDRLPFAEIPLRLQLRKSGERR